MDGEKKRTKPLGLPKTGGKPKGYKFPATLAKEAAREVARKRITERLLPIIDAQIDSAIGIAHFMVRDPETGQWERLTNVDKIRQALNHPKAKQGSTYWIYTKDPNAQAAREMLDRALDRPKEQEQTIVVRDEEKAIATLREGMAKAAARNRRAGDA